MIMGRAFLDVRRLDHAAQRQLVTALLVAIVGLFGCCAKLRAQESQPRPGADHERETWRKAMVRTPLPKNGCFKAEYPNNEWQEVTCLPPSKYPNPPQQREKRGKGPSANTVGAGSGDWSALSTGIISSAEGLFRSVNSDGQTLSIQGPIGGGGSAQNNVWMLQINSNFFTPPVCAGVSQCAWVQFLYSQTQCGSTPCIYLEYWLINYGTCPARTAAAPWIQYGTSCYFNTSPTSVGAQNITNLANIVLTGNATSGGQDSVAFGTSGSLFANGADSVVTLSQYWNTAEFNIFGDCCSSATTFTSPATLVLETDINDGTVNIPTCHSQSFTAETNNLNLGICCPYGGATPRIEFMETNAGHTAVCGPTALEGDPHITTADGTHYDFQAAGEFISLQDSDGAEIQTRQTPVATTALGTDAYDGLSTCVSLNTAVAARVGEHRITYEPNLQELRDPTSLQLRIDGVLTSLGSTGIDLGNGGRVVPSLTGGNLEVDFPDGKTLFVTPQFWSTYGKWYLNVDVAHLGLVPLGGSTALRGIAGPILPGSWIPALPSGASLGPMPATLPQRYSELYQKFADAWRVTDKDSLFDYAPGTSTATFTNKKWPAGEGRCTIPDTKPVEPTSLEVAEAACRRVLDANRHADCVFDVKTTGDIEFAKTYLVTQLILRDSTTINFTNDPEPSQLGEAVTFTAVVAANGSAAERPSGTVQFSVDGRNVGAPVTVDAKGRAVWETTSLRLGKHRVSATYVPESDSEFLPSNSVAKVHIVKRCPCEDRR